MILHAIRVERFAGYAQAAFLGPLTEGLNVISAPNESGKSTMMDAAARALFDRHTSKGAEIRELRPAGTSLAPRVEVEFETLEGKFRIQKTFLESPSSVLSEWIQNHYQVVAEADLADERIVAGLQTTLAPRGSSRPERWGLLRYLWTRQGEATDWPGWDGDGGQRVVSGLVRVDLDSQAEALIRKLQERYLEQFTRTGQTKASSQLSSLNSEIDQLNASLAEIDATSQLLESKEIRYAEIDRELQRLESELTQYENTRDLLTKDNEATESLRRDIERFEEKLQSAERDLNAIRKDKENLQSIASRLETLDAELAVAQPNQSKLKRARRQKLAELEAAEKELETSQVAAESARRALHRYRSIAEIQRMRRQRKNLVDLREELAQERRKTLELEERFASLPELDAMQLQRLRELNRKQARLDAQRNAQGLRLSLTPDKETTVDIARPDQDPETVNLKAQSPNQFDTGPEASLKIPGFGQIEIRSQVDSLKELERQLATTTKEIEEVLTVFRLTSLDDAEAAHVQYAQLADELESRKRRQRESLGEFESLGDLEDAIERLSAQLARRLTQDNLGDDDIEIQELELESELARAESQVKHFEVRVDTSRKERGAIKEASENLGRQLADLERDAENKTLLKRRLELDRDHIRERYPDGIDEALETRQAEFVRAEARLQHSVKELPNDWNTIGDRRKRAISALEECRLELETKRREQSRLEGELGAIGSQELFSRRAEISEKLTKLEADRDALRRDALASGFLVHILEKHKSATIHKALKPLEDRLSETFAQLSGDPSRRVFLNANLELVGVGVRADRAIPFRRLSQGAKEQLLLALRAAIALELGDEERHCLALDDPLVNTDPDRQERALDFLTQLGERAQVLVLTCHPSRYRGVGAAQSIHIQDL